MNPHANFTSFYQNNFEAGDSIQSHDMLQIGGSGSPIHRSNPTRALMPTSGSSLAAPGHVSDHTLRPQLNDMTRPLYESFGLSNSIMHNNSASHVMNGTSSQREISRRPQLPTGWNAGGVYGSVPASSTLMRGPASSAFGGQVQMDDDIIETALVFKNIPFGLSREDLLKHMEKMGLPAPFAFNYHFSDGAFHGLGFANYANKHEAQTVLSVMDGHWVDGRALRVEYKKQLPEHERIRAEREKRRKRGQLKEQHQQMATQGQISSIGTSTAGNRPPRDLDFNDQETLEFYSKLLLFVNDDAKEFFLFDATLTPQQRTKIHHLAHYLKLYHDSTGVGENRQICVSKRRLDSSGSQQTLLTYDNDNRPLNRSATYDFSGNGLQPISRTQRNLDVTVTENNTPLSILRGYKSYGDMRSYNASPAPSMSSLPGNGGLSVHQSSVARYNDYHLLTPHRTPSTSALNGAQQMQEMSVDMHISSSMASLGLGSAYDRPRESPGAIGSNRLNVNN